MKKIFIIVTLMTITVTAMSVPARREGVIRTAEDGTEKMVWLHGDAFFHYMTDSEGRWLNEETLQPLNETERAAMEQVGVARNQVRKAKQGIGGAPNLAPRGLIILVNFQNMSFTTPHDTIDSLMNGVNFSRTYDYNFNYYGTHYEGTVIASGSARQYFQDQSYGQYNPVFDVVGPYTVSKNYEFYGKNTSGGGISSEVGTMIKEACELANQHGADFTLYDNDLDGKVDFVYVIYAGEGEADGGNVNTIWPHNAGLERNWGKSCTVDGKRIDNYACSNEINHYSAIYTGIGTFCHEFSHVIGLPDLYATNNATHKTCGRWDILDYGPYNNDGNTPPGYSTYERFFCGWLTPRVLSTGEVVTLPTIDEQEALLLCSGDSHNLSGYAPNPNTFYLLEARKQEGWDEYIPGEGLMITKVTFSSSSWYQNTVNNTANAQGVDILEADGVKPSYIAGNDNGWKGKATDLFPAGATQWTAFANHEVTNIAWDGVAKQITFKYRGGWPTEIEHAEAVQPAQKVLRDGKIVIIRGNKEYDILGHENHQL